MIYKNKNIMKTINTLSSQIGYYSANEASTNASFQQANLGNTSTTGDPTWTTISTTPWNTNQPVWIDPNYVNGYQNQNNYHIQTDLQLDQNTIEFLEMVLLVMGVDMTYDEFLNMSPSERKSFIRNIKINQITK